MPSKQITINYENKEYTLEYNRAVVILMERQGFNINELDSKAVLNTSLLVRYAFFLHHRKLAEDKIFEIYDSITNRDGFVEKLIDMCSDTYVSILNDPEDNGGETEGNATWGASW